MNRLFTFVTATAIPIIAFFFANRRMFDVGWAFFLHELFAHAIVVVSLAVFGVILMIVRTQFLLPAAFLNTMSRVGARVWSLGWLFAIVIVLSLTPYVYARYRHFSEVFHQEQALAEIADGNILAATNFCRRYLKLYPQRRAEGTWRDPVCVPLLDYVRDVEGLRNYLSSLKPKRRTIDGIEIPWEWNANRFTNHLTGAITGRNRLWSEDIDKGPIERLEITLPIWKSYSNPSFKPSWGKLIAEDRRIHQITGSTEDRSGNMNVVEENRGEQIKLSENLITEEALRKFKVEGVASNNALNIRESPGVNGSIIGAIPADGRDIQLTADKRSIGSSIWVQIRWGDIVGWVNSRYLTEDLTR